MIQVEKARELFNEVFHANKRERALTVYSHGRLEIIGNHTDHNNGFAMVAGCDLGITARCIKDLGGVVVASPGFRPFQFNIAELEYKKEEEGSSLAIAKGVLFKMKQLGYEIGGFHAALVSDILPGSGVSSSACFEALIVRIQLAFYNPGVEMDPLEMAQICHFAESKYFGKPCGYLDQIGVCYGGMQLVDFEYFSKPKVESLPFDLPLTFVLVLPKSSHAELTAYYAQIPEDMELIADRMFGKRCLRECDRAEFMSRIAVPLDKVPDRAKLRAQHYFDENLRVLAAKEAIEKKNTDEFLQLLNQSGLSSRTLLCNTMVPGGYQNSPQQALDLTAPYLHGGAQRVHGGGFAGGILCVLHKADVDAFLAAVRPYYGEDRVLPIDVVNGGPRVVSE